MRKVALDPLSQQRPPCPSSLALSQKRAQPACAPYLPAGTRPADFTFPFTCVCAHVWVLSATCLCAGLLVCVGP